MTELNRRSLSVAAASAPPAGPWAAGAAGAAGAADGQAEDIDHFIILMKENRSLDHNFRTLRGLRGCDDPTAATLGSDAAASWRAEQVCPRPAVGSRLSRACGRVAAP